MRVVPIVALIAVVGGAVTAAQRRKIDFEQDTVGQAPKGFTFGLTRKVGSPVFFSGGIVRSPGAGPPERRLLS